MTLAKIDLLYPYARTRQKPRFETAYTDLFLAGNDPNRIAKLAIQKVLAEHTSVATSFTDFHFVNDLHVPILVKNFFKMSYAGPFVLGIFTAPPSDTATIAYRQDIVRELSGADARKEAETSSRDLEGILDAYQGMISAGRGEGDMTNPYYYPRRVGDAQQHAATLAFLYSYVQAVERMAKVSFASGLAGICTFARQVQESEPYRELKEHVLAFTDNLTINAQVEITFNALGTVTRASIHPVTVEKREESLTQRLSKHTSFFLRTLFSQLDDLAEKNIQPALTFASYIGELEFYLGMVHFSERLKKAGFPTVFPAYEGSSIAIQQLHNPLILLQEDELHPSDRPHPSIPNDVFFDDQHRLYVITGPNDGGKSFFLKAAGLGILCGQNGGLLPALRAHLFPCDGIYTHVIPPDDVRHRRGRNREELTQLRHIFECATRKSVVLLDEPCGSTDPGQGESQSLTTLKHFHRYGCPTIFATHMHAVAEAVEEGIYPRAHNLQVGIDVLQNPPVLTYQVLGGRAGQSYGELVARDVGVDDASLEQLYVQRFGDAK